MTQASQEIKEQNMMDSMPTEFIEKLEGGTHISDAEILSRTPEVPETTMEQVEPSSSAAGDSSRTLSANTDVEHKEDVSESEVSVGSTLLTSADVLVEGKSPIEQADLEDVIQNKVI